MQILGKGDLIQIARGREIVLHPLHAYVRIGEIAIGRQRREQRQIRRDGRCEYAIVVAKSDQHAPGPRIADKWCLAKI